MTSYLMDPKEQREAADAAAEAAWQEPPDERPLWLNVYELDRHRGGPEEGGWWYDSGTVLVSIPLHDLTPQECDQLETLMHKAFPEANPGSRESRFCSIYSGGDYSVLLEPVQGESWPEERPHYE